jgi:hypothetical protein
MPASQAGRRRFDPGRPLQTFFLNSTTYHQGKTQFLLDLLESAQNVPTAKEQCACSRRDRPDRQKPRDRSLEVRLIRNAEQIFCGATGDFSRWCVKWSISSNRAFTYIVGLNPKFTNLKPADH